MRGPCSKSLGGLWTHPRSALLRSRSVPRHDLPECDRVAHPRRRTGDRKPRDRSSAGDDSVDDRGSGASFPIRCLLQEHQLRVGAVLRAHAFDQVEPVLSDPELRRGLVILLFALLMAGAVGAD